MLFPPIFGGFPMTRARIAAAAFALALALPFLPSSAFGDEPKPEDAKALAQKILDEGAKDFSRKDARVMARSYTEDAEAKLVSKEESGGIKTETHRGRVEIEAFYRKLFESDQKGEARNTVEYARYLGPTLLMITGKFKPIETGEIELEFVQIRQKDGDHWLIRDMQVFLVPKS